MTSKLKIGDGFNNGDHTPTKPILFFKIIHRDTLSQGKLMIPTKFVGRYGKHLSNTMFLNLPNGAKWKVNLEKLDGTVWLYKGWKKFAEYHSLAHGSLLMFKYDGTPHFNVIICGLSAMEIDYPLNNIVKRANNSEPRQQRKKGKTSAKNKGTLKKGGAYAAGGITSFTVIIKEHHVTKKKFMNLPLGTLEGYIKPGTQKVTLIVGDKSWGLNLVYYKDHSSIILSAGWNRFSRENNLKVGDACFFKLLKGTGDMVMKVSILKLSSY